MRDAAIITVANQAMTDGGWLSVRTFIETYSKEGKDREGLQQTLLLFGLVWEQYKAPSTWNEEGKYIQRWKNETE